LSSIEELAYFSQKSYFYLLANKIYRSGFAWFLYIINLIMFVNQSPLIILEIIILLMGLFGGTVNYYQNFDEKTGSRRKF